MPLIRWNICSEMQDFGLAVDANRNEHSDKLPADLSAEHSKVRILAIQTNEELAIAKRIYSTMEPNADQVEARRGDA